MFTPSMRFRAKTHILLELTRVEAPEKLLHLLETRREERELEGRRQLTRVRVTETNSFRIR